MHFSRSAFISRSVPVLIASKHLLYVHLAVWNQSLRICFCAFVGHNRIFRVLRPVLGVTVALGGKVNAETPCNAVVATVNHEKLSVCEVGSDAVGDGIVFVREKHPSFQNGTGSSRLRFLLSMIQKIRGRDAERKMATRAPFYSFPRRVPARKIMKSRI